ncbi:hypothetical protein MOO44_00010 (plasmid) [Nicoliella spurrieriana]|uniref:Uncharacterized protein n=1 Tax=Nicoliella spurrieriana TaxID=2925830 RepID=A0A976RQR5_9LACO|nr:hypothetical protein [Nicoliella spurrieriana]UQS86063.1 hypothetical protein MOO44_00010 [Nicoliella spurrieriana]
MIQWVVKPFNELTLAENHAIQNFVSVNGNNQADRKAYHVWATNNEQIISYVRIYELDGDLTFDRFRFNHLVNPESLVYRVLELGSRFFDCDYVKVIKPFDESLLSVYDRVGFKENDNWLMMRYYH